VKVPVVRVSELRQPAREPAHILQVFGKWLPLRLRMLFGSSVRIGVRPELHVSKVLDIDLANVISLRMETKRNNSRLLNLTRVFLIASA
jgi:hypothetical protein